MPSFTGTNDIELVLLSQLGFPPPSKHTDGSRPHYFWVSPGGADAVGNGSYKEPYLTPLRALRECVDGRGDFIIVSPGRYRQNLDIGSGSTARGATDGYAKRDVKIIGAGGVHPGRIQIVGDGTSDGPTLRVRDGFLRGFYLRGLELGTVNSDDADRARVILDLETNDTGTLTAISDDYHAQIEDVTLAGDGTPTAGLVLTGATMVRVKNLEVRGCIRGIVFRGSVNNNPENCKFWDTIFHDNVTADVATAGLGLGYAEVWSASASGLTNIQFFRPQFLDRGATPVTNYADVRGTHVNCGFYEFIAGRDVADDTLMALSVDWIAIGRSAAAAEFIIGA